jgi:hypothetical protein
MGVNGIARGLINVRVITESDNMIPQAEVTGGTPTPLRLHERNTFIVNTGLVSRVWNTKSTPTVIIVIISIGLPFIFRFEI